MYLAHYSLELKKCFCRHATVTSAVTDSYNTDVTDVMYP